MKVEAARSSNFLETCFPLDAELRMCVSRYRNEMEARTRLLEGELCRGKGEAETRLPGAMGLGIQGGKGTRGRLELFPGHQKY